MSFPRLTTATLETLNWTNLSSVVFTCTDDSGLDNINLTPVPEPSSFMLLGLVAGLAYRRVRHRPVSSAP